MILLSKLTSHLKYEENNNRSTIEISGCLDCKKILDFSKLISHLIEKHHKYYCHQCSKTFIDEFQILHHDCIKLFY